MTEDSAPASPATTRARSQRRTRTRAPAWAEPLGDWLILGGSIALFGSLFLAWSHQFSPFMLAQLGSSDALRGVPHDPTAWQVYSAADVMLALLAGSLVLVATIGNRAARQCATVAAVIALIFVVHALSAPPTNGALIFNPANAVPQYIPNSPGAGPGETLAILALLAVLGGLTLTFVYDKAVAAA